MVVRGTTRSEISQVICNSYISLDNEPCPVNEVLKSDTQTHLFDRDYGTHIN